MEKESRYKTEYAEIYAPVVLKVLQVGITTRRSEIIVKRRVNVDRAAETKRVEPTTFYGYSIESLVCLADALRLKNIQPEQLERWMLDLDFAIDIAWKLFKGA